MIIRKYTFDQNQIVQNYYQPNAECLKYPKRIISKISDEGVLAVGYITLSSLHLQHYDGVNGTSLGNMISIDEKAEEIYLDINGNISLVGWSEFSNGCGNREQQYKAQMYEISGTSVTNISPVIQLNRRYNTALSSLSLLDDQQFSAIFQSEGEKVMSSYSDKGELIQEDVVPEVCPNPDVAQRRMFMRSDVRVISAAIAVGLAVTAWHGSVAFILQQFRPDEGNNPARYPLQNTMYHKLDSIKLPWVHEENPNCQGTDFYTSFITPAGLSTEIFHIVRHEGSYDN